MLQLFSSVSDRILFVLADNDDIHKSLNKFEIRPNPTPISELPALERPKNRCCHVFSAVFHRILFILTGYDDIHESSESSKFGQI